MRRELEFTMDLEEIGLVDTSPVLELDMHCPQVSNCAPTVNNWSTKQCALRVEVGSPCVKRCVYGRSLKPPEKTKKHVKPVVDLNSKWPGNKKERNLSVTVDCINGMSIADIAVKYKVSKPNLRRVVYRYFAIASADVNLVCPENENKIDFARANKELILPHLVWRE